MFCFARPIIKSLPLMIHWTIASECGRTMREFWQFFSPFVFWHGPEVLKTFSLLFFSFFYRHLKFLSGRWPLFFIEFTHFSTHQTFNSIRSPIACLLLPSSADNVRLHDAAMSCQLSLSRIEPTDTLNYVQTTEHRLSSLATAHRCSASQFLYTSWFIGFYECVPRY